MAYRAQLRAPKYLPTYTPYELVHLWVSIMRRLTAQATSEVTVAQDQNAGLADVKACKPNKRC